MKPKILFVDDEQNVLDSLRLSLRPLRGKWDMGFALGGEAALKVLSESPHEVVVSDMRMPGIDGAQLLHEVQQRYPECVRIILSGYADEGSVLKTVRLAHQYLSKPCRPVDIIQAVDKVLSLRDVLASRQIKTIISKLETLPALSKTYSQLATALQDESTTLKTVGDIVGKDVAISASILRLVNSAFFGLPTRVSSIHHAVNLLGAQTLRVLVLSTHLFSCLENKDLPSFSIGLLWEHSLRVACFAKAIAEQEGASTEARDDSFIAGMLHDVGKLVLSINMRAEFEEVLEKSVPRTAPCMSRSARFSVRAMRKSGLISWGCGASTASSWRLFAGIMTARTCAAQNFRRSLRSISPTLWTMNWSRFMKDTQSGLWPCNRSSGMN